MYAILLLLLTIGLSVGAPFSSFDLKRPTDASAFDKQMIPETTSKLLTIVKKNLKPNKDQSTVLLSEELVIASTGFPTFDAFDQNSDGFIEFEEFAATDGKDHKRNFQKADTNGDHKLTPEEFSQLSLVVYEPEEEYTDSDGEEPPMVFLTPPESITRFDDKEVKSDSETGFEDYKDAESDSFAKEETKEDKEVKNEDDKEETISEDKPKDTKRLIETESQKTDVKSDKQTEKSETKETENKEKEGSHFTAEDMPVKIDEEDDEEMIDVKDEDIPMEVIDDLNDDNHYDIDGVRQPQEDDKQMNDQMNSIE